MRLLDSALREPDGPYQPVRSLRKYAAKHPLVVFFGLAYAGSWTAVLLMVLLGGAAELMTVFGLSPVAAALVTHRLSTGMSISHVGLPHHRHFLKGVSFA